MRPSSTGASISSAIVSVNVFVVGFSSNSFCLSSWLMPTNSILSAYSCFVFWIFWFMVSSNGVSLPSFSPHTGQYWLVISSWLWSVMGVVSSMRVFLGLTFLYVSARLDRGRPQGF